MKYPYKSLLEVNNDVHAQLRSVVESFTDENLKTNVDNYDRDIAMIVSHTLNTLSEFYINQLVLGEKRSTEPKINSVKDALKMIDDNLLETSKLIESFPESALLEVITTEWGQSMSKEMVVWSGILQIMLHLGEITLIAGQKGFYKGILG